jgi:hypothetical protein
VKSDPEIYELTLVIDLTDLSHSTEYVDLGYQRDWHKFVKPNCMDRPGLTVAEFFSLFAQCKACMLITAHQASSNHYCILQEEDDLELTDQE